MDKDYNTLELDAGQVEVLEECGVYPGDLRHIDPKSVHDFVIYNHAYTDGEKLVFFDEYRGGSFNDQQKWIYYVGGENDAKVEARFRGVTVYDGVGDRVDRRAEDVPVGYEDPPEDG